MTVKAILDTNVIISGIFWKGAPFEILKAWQEYRFRLAITLPILNEYRRVLNQMTKKRTVFQRQNEYPSYQPLARAGRNLSHTACSR